jgi:predicted TIM-barrel fold metal-dependent hydrolase
VRWLLKAWPNHPVPETVTAEDIIADLKNQGASHFFNFAYPLKVEETEPLNRFNKEFCDQTPGAIPFASLHQDSPAKDKIAEHAIASGFVGFKFHPFVQRFDPWDTRMDPLYAFLQDAGRPVIFHTGFEAFYMLKMPVAELGKLKKRFPRLPMVFVHMTFPELEWAFNILSEYPDLYLDATNVLACFRPFFKPFLDTAPGGDKLLDVLLSGLTEHKGRVMYGSDHPAGMGALSDIYSDLDALDIDDDTRTWVRGYAAKAFIEKFEPDHDWNANALDNGGA